MDKGKGGGIFDGKGGTQGNAGSKGPKRRMLAMQRNIRNVPSMVAELGLWAADSRQLRRSASTLEPRLPRTKSSTLIEDQRVSQRHQRHRKRTHAANFPAACFWRLHSPHCGPPRSRTQKMVQRKSVPHRTLLV